MYNDGQPEFVVEQGMYYPAPTNYGYISTGLETPANWDDHHNVFGLDGQNIQYTGAQTESLPYVYYTPSYGYAQSPYNPYNPYIPGAMIGVDGPFVGAQPYYTFPSYENPVSSSTYFPMIVQSPDIVANGTTDLYMDTIPRVDGRGPKHSLSSSSATYTLNPAKSGSNQAGSYSRVPEGSKANSGPSKQTAAQGNITPVSFYSPASTQVPQARNAQVIDNVSQGKAWANRNQLKVPLPSGNGLSNFGSSAHGGPMVEKVRPKFHSSRVPGDVNGNPDTSTEHNRGPRTSKSKNCLTVKAYTSRAGDSDAEGNIIIHTDQYNKDDFPIDYDNAKFFVIKSYSEDDVHKSIKYNVWSSTPNGNKKLNSAYEDAQRTSSGEPQSCPIFLFFSVNASGQFCGVCEMTGPVDFHRDMDFWQQDKWSGSFPVKWHMLKDVPNPNFRHIILENNENKPVTNSRDTQEIRYKKGMEMLRIFKSYTSKTSLLDDFMYYENRQRILQEEKARLLIRSYQSPFLVPVIDPPRKLNRVLDLPSTEDDKITEHKHPNIFERDVPASASTPTAQVTADADGSEPSTTNENVKHGADERANDGEIPKISSLKISSKQTELKPGEGPSAPAANSEAVDVVTIGSMPVKVNGYGKSAGYITVGTIPLDPRALQLDVAPIPSKSGSKKG